MPALDFVRDNNPATLVRGLLPGIAMPDYTDGNWPTQEEMDGLQKTAFADPENRLHPLHTKSAAFMTALYVANADVPVTDDVVARIEKAASAHGISDDVKPLLEQFAQNKAASADVPAFDSFALRDGSRVFYPLGTRLDLQKSATGIMDDIRRELLPAKYVRGVCEKVVKRANELGYSLLDLPDDVVKYGSSMVPRPDSLVQQAEWRFRLTGDPLYKAAVEVYKEGLSEEDLCAGIEAWSELDSMHNVKVAAMTPSVLSCWCDGLPLAQVKEASRHTMWFGSDPVATGALTAVPDDVIEAWYAGDSLVKVKTVKQAASRHGEEASQLLDAMTADQRAVLASHLHRYHARK